DADELRASDHQHTHLRPHTDRTVLEDPATTTPRQRPRYSATARQVVVRVTPSIEPISSVTRRPTASSVGPSTTAMKSNGPVTASRLATVESVPWIAASSFLTAFVFPGAVSMRTYARIFFDPPFVISHLPWAPVGVVWDRACSDVTRVSLADRRGAATGDSGPRRRSRRTK